MARERIARSHRRAARSGIRTRGHLRRPWPRRVAAGLVAVGAVQQRDQSSAHATGRHARPRGFRRQRASGSAGTRTTAGGRTFEPDRAALQPGAGCRHGRKLRRGARHLRSVAHRVPCRCSPARIHRRGAFQRAELFAQLRPHAGAARARLRAADGRERGDGQGSEDLRPERFPDRTLPNAGHELLRGQSPNRAAARRLGKPAVRDRHHCLLCCVRLHRMAHAPRRLFHWRSHVSRGLLPTLAQPAGEPAHGILAGGGPGALPRRPVLVLRDPAGNRSAAESAAISCTDSGGLRVRERGVSLPRGRALGGAWIDIRAARGRGPGARGGKRRRQDHPRQAAGTALRSGRGPHSARRA